MRAISRPLHVLRSGLATFAGDNRGNTAILFAISLVPLLGIVGFGLDYTFASRQKSLLQNSLDGAVLAGAQALAQGNSNPSPVVTQYISSALANKVSQTPTVTVSVQNTGVSAVSASATMTIPNTFMRLIGTPNTTVVANSQATFGAGKLEVALVLDVTYSMTGAKLAAAQSAAGNLVDTLFALPNAASSVKVGLVPFTYYVNVGTTYAGANWLTSTAPVSHTTSSTTTYTTCTTPATYSSTLTSATCTGTNDGVPVTYDCSYYAQLTPAGGCTTTTGPYTYTSNFNWNGCVGSRNYPLDLNDTVALTDPVPALVTDPTFYYSYGCPAPLQRLTTDSVSLKTQINALVAQQETYIAPGLLWGWRVVSPNAPFADGGAYGPATKKAIVLMTDGYNTHSANYPDHEAANVTDANNVTAATCNNIKTAGVAIYTIAFQVTDPTIKSILQSCATSVSYYYDATTIAALQSAFTSIGAQMTALRLSQ